MSVVHAFGDSHAHCFSSRPGTAIHSTSSITCYRVGRDGKGILNFKQGGAAEKDVVLVLYGEVDCRCQILKQMLRGRDYEEIASELVKHYFDTIKANADDYAQLSVIVCCIPPPCCQRDFESVHGPITHEFPFLGTDEERSFFTVDLNRRIKAACAEHHYYFLDYYDLYARPTDGMLDVKYSRNDQHIQDARMLLDCLEALLVRIKEESLRVP